MLTFFASFPGEPAAGLCAYTDTVTVDCEAAHGDPGFAEHIQQALVEWFDGATVTLCLWYWDDGNDRIGPFPTRRDAFEAARLSVGEGRTVVLTDGTDSEEVTT